MKKVVILLLVAVFFLILLLFYNSDTGETYEVVLKEEGFYPKELTIKKGDTVTFRTDRGERFWPASDLHPLHDIYSDFDPKKSIGSDLSWSFKFKKVGEWKYHDHLFPYYRGIVKVVERSNKNTEIVADSISESEIVEKVESLFLQNSPEEAYKKMVEQFSLASNFVSHLAAHVFGEKLFEITSENGILTCSEAFGFGCFHGFIARAVAEGGEESAVEADKKCVDKYGVMGLGCPHGIGHGLGEYFGFKRLNEQLAICRKLTWTGEILGCSGGVFMEHNLPSKEENRADTFFESKKMDRFYPCSEIADYLSSCYFELPQKWESYLEKKAEEVGSWCSEITNKEHSKFCFMGVGYAKAVISRNAEWARVECDKVSTREEDVATCYSGVAWSLFSDPVTRDYVPEFCGKLKGEHRDICLDYQVVLKQSER